MILNYQEKILSAAEQNQTNKKDLQQMCKPSCFQYYIIYILRYRTINNQKRKMKNDFHRQRIGVYRTSLYSPYMYILAAGNFNNAIKEPLGKSCSSTPHHWRRLLSNHMLSITGATLDQFSRSL